MAMNSEELRQHLEAMGAASGRPASELMAEWSRAWPRLPDRSPENDAFAEMVAHAFHVPGYLLGHRPPTRWERFLICTRLSRLRWR